MGMESMSRSNAREEGEREPMTRDAMMTVLETAKKRGGLMPNAEAAALIGAQNPTAQKELAQDFFKSAIMDNFSAESVNSAYQVYAQLKGTEFSNTFRELESARLVAAGYSPLTL
jgi:hypothetical protein